MKKLIKITGWVFGILITLIIITGIAIKVIVTKDFIATKIENAINGRVEIRDISVPLWAAFSGISIDGFKIANKDAEMTKPMKDRTPVSKEVIGFEKFEFKIAVGKLITSFGKDFELKSFVLVKPKANVILYENGTNNILPLLVKAPEPVKKEAAGEPEAKVKPAKKEAAVVAAATKEKAQPTAEEKVKKPFSIKSVPSVIKMGKIGIEDGEFVVNIQKIQNTLVVNNVNFLLKDIYIDPQNLDKPDKNRVNMTNSLNMELKENNKVDAAVSSFLFIFSSNGTIQPFNPKTGGTSEIMTVEAIFHKNTKITGLAVFKKLKSGTEQLKKIGINLDFLKDDIALTDDSKVKIEYNYGKITFLSDLVIDSVDSSIVVAQKSWVDINSYENLMTGSIKLAPNHTATIEKQVDSALKPAVDAVVGNIPANLRSAAGSSLNVETLRNNILQPARDDKNRITLGYKSTGKLSHPSVSIVKPEFPSAKEVVAQESGKLKGNANTMIKGQVDQAKKQATDAAKKEADKATEAAKENIKQEAANKLKKLF